MTLCKCREQFLPPIDPDNEQFVIYVRSKKGLKTWFPLNVVTGGSTANTLVKGLDSIYRKMCVFLFSIIIFSLLLADGSEITDKQYWPSFVQRAGSAGRNGQKNAYVEECERT